MIASRARLALVLGGWLTLTMPPALSGRRRVAEEPRTVVPVETSWRALVQRTNAAVEAKDWKTARPLLEESLKALHGNPRTLYRLAAVEAQLGERDSALPHLARYAGMGLEAPPKLEEDFRMLANAPEFSQIRQRFKRNGRSIASATAAFALADAGVVPEDIAFDRARDRFLVTSNRERKVLAVDRQGHATDFVPRSPSVWAMSGIAVDVARRRVWVSMAATEGMLDASESDRGKTALLEFHADTAQLIHRWDLPPVENTEQLLGDIALAPNGDVIAGDSYGALYRFRDGVDQPETLVERGVLASAQEPAVTADGRYAIVADYVLGLARIDLRTREWRWIEQPPRGAALCGIDGLVLAGNRAIAVQNGVNPERIASLTFDESFTRVLRWSVLEQRTQTLHEPTHGVIVGGSYYFIANSEGSKLGQNGAAKQGETLLPASIMKLSLH